MNKLKLALSVFAILSLAGCAAPAQQSTSSSNPSVDVEVVLTDKDSYTVKRFWSGGTRYYYVTPGPARVTHMETQGKQTTNISVDTIGR
jgi:hypothetical protein